MSVRLGIGMTRLWRRLAPDEREIKESVEDRQVIKVVAVAAATLLFLLVVAGWL